MAWPQIKKMAEFDFGEAFKEAFGYNPPTDISKLQLAEKAARREQSAKGYAFYATDLSGREFFIPVYLDGALIPFAVIGMRWAKNIISTSMPERGGSVNELISIDDYSFTIKGLLVNEDGHFPDTEIEDLHKIFEKNKSITLRSVLSDIVLSGRPDISGDDDEGHRVIIKNIAWPATSGVEHVKPFEIEVMSDMIFNLEIE